MALTYFRDSTGIPRTVTVLHFSHLPETYVSAAKDIIEESALIRDKVLPAMTELRVVCDEAETLTDRAHWPFPTYGELLFGVRN